MSPESEVEVAKEDLSTATRGLNQLADWLEHEFKEPEVIPDREITIEDAKKRGMFGSKELLKTGDFVCQALSAVACNVDILARHFVAKLENLAQDIDKADQDVYYVTAQASFHSRRLEMAPLKNLMVKKENVSDSPKYHRRYKLSLDQEESYVRDGIRFDTLDHIGTKVDISEEAASEKRSSLTASISRSSVYYPDEKRFASMRRQSSIKSVSGGARRKFKMPQKPESVSPTCSLLSLDMLPPMPEPDDEEEDPLDDALRNLDALTVSLDKDISDTTE